MKCVTLRGDKHHRQLRIGWTLGKCRSMLNIETGIKRPNTSIWTGAMKTAPCLENELVSG